jgi:alkanesulfonate monooxygenase
MRPLEFGWYLPTHGDTTAYGLMDAQIPGSPELCAWCRRPKRPVSNIC